VSDTQSEFLEGTVGHLWHPQWLRHNWPSCRWKSPSWHIQPDLLETLAMDRATCRSDDWLWPGFRRTPSAQICGCQQNFNRPSPCHVYRKVCVCKHSIGVNPLVSTVSDIPAVFGRVDAPVIFDHLIVNYICHYCTLL